MSYTHAQGKLEADARLNLVDKHGNIIARLACTTGKYESEELNARRLVACWNACEGITTERLEDLGRPLMKHLIGCDERAARQVKEAAALTAQRDELLTALKQLADMDITVHGLAGMQRVANAAIAEFEGPAS